MKKSHVFGISLLLLVANIVANHQSFGVGLVIMIASLITQIIIENDHVSLEWNNFKNFSKDEKMFSRNVVFNLSKFITIISMFVLLLSSSYQKNYFTDLGLSIFIAVSVILMLIIYFSTRYNASFYCLKNLLATIVLMLILVTTYLYFGTQLIWIPVLMMLLTAIFEIFNGIKAAVKLNPFYLLIALTVTAVLSTIIQFAKIELFLGLLMWHAALILIFLLSSATILIIKIIKKAEKKEKLGKEKKEAERRQRLMTEAQEKQRKIDEEVRAGIEKLSNVNFESYILLNDDLMFLASISHRQSKDFISLIFKVDLFNLFVTVSHVKKQIFWLPGLEAVLSMYDDLCKQSQSDDEIKKLMAVIVSLSDQIKTIDDEYIGKKNLLALIKNKTCNMPIQ